MIVDNNKIRFVFKLSCLYILLAWHITVLIVNQYRRVIKKWESCPDMGNCRRGETSMELAGALPPPKAELLAPSKNVCF